MAGIFTPPTIRQRRLPSAPTIADESVQAAADAEAARYRRGRASTVLTNQQSQRTAEKSQQTYLGGA